MIPASVHVPINFAYSLIFGLLTGNSNIVKVPSQNFVQIKIICDAINKVLKKGFNNIKKTVSVATIRIIPSIRDTYVGHGFSLVYIKYVMPDISITAGRSHHSLAKNISEESLINSKPL